MTTELIQMILRIMAYTVTVFSIRSITERCYFFLNTAYLSMTAFAVLAAVLILAKCLAQLWLERLNQRYVLAHSDAVPDSFKEIIDEATYKKSVAYTLAKGRLDQTET